MPITQSIIIALVMSAVFSPGSQAAAYWRLFEVYRGIYPALATAMRAL